MESRSSNVPSGCLLGRWCLSTTSTAELHTPWVCDPLKSSSIALAVVRHKVGFICVEIRFWGVGIQGLGFQDCVAGDSGVYVRFIGLQELGTLENEHQTRNVPYWFCPKPSTARSSGATPFASSTKALKRSHSGIELRDTCT